MTGPTPTRISPGLARRRHAPAARTLLHTPGRLLTGVLVAIFTVDMFIGALLVVFFDAGTLGTALLGAGLLAALMAPLLYLGVGPYLQQEVIEHEADLVKLIESEQRFRDIAENAKEWIWEVDAEGRYTYASPVIEEILGYAPDEVLGKHYYEFFHPDDRDALKEAAEGAFESRQPFRDFINRNVHRNGQTVWLSTSGIPVVGENGRLLGYRGADTVKHDEASITDLLTGVLNRQGFFLLAEQQLALAVRNDLRVALLFADMDNLKSINDQLGHQGGDQAIADVARIIKGSVRASDTVSRFGGDEFVVLLTGRAEQDVEQVVLKHLDQEFAEFNTLGGRPYKLAVSVGLAVYSPNAPETLEELTTRADRAMYEEKRRRKRARSA